MIGMLLALSAYCVFPLRLHASLPRTYLLLAFCANGLGLRPPAACCTDAENDNADTSLSCLMAELPAPEKENADDFPRPSTTALLAQTSKGPC